VSPGAWRLARNLDGADPGAFSQAELHTFIDAFQLGIGELHGEIAHIGFPPPVPASAAA
jgi:hypothetical protein